MGVGVIKKGDLVMVVRAYICEHCGVNDSDVGRIYTAGDFYSGETRCSICDGDGSVDSAVWVGNDTVKSISRLKKIDPPATGETREAYKNLKVPA